MNTSPVAVVCYAYYARHLPQLAHTVSRFLHGLHGLHGLPGVEAGDEGAAGVAGVQPPVVVVRAPQLPSAALQIGGPGGTRVQTVELAYDGSGWEFGAYQRGLDWLAEHGFHGTVAVFNDTAGVHYPLRRSELVAMRRFAQQALADEVALMGGVQSQAGFTMHDLPVASWVRSNAFVMTAAARAALHNRIYFADEFNAPKVTAQGLQLPSHLSPALGRYIQQWLTSAGPEGWRWHAGWAEPPAEVLRGKAGSILLEKLLAARVLAAGGTLLPSQAPQPGRLQQLADRAFYWSRRVARWRAPPRAAEASAEPGRA
ncbi:MAG: hypothetical protein LH480_09850 [Rubrivivax sp.]|nr:hypothetical protein [Rubrivivax sp.]